MEALRTGATLSLLTCLFIPPCLTRGNPTESLPDPAEHKQIVYRYIPIDRQFVEWDQAYDRYYRSSTTTDAPLYYHDSRNEDNIDNNFYQYDSYGNKNQVGWKNSFGRNNNRREEVGNNNRHEQTGGYNRHEQTGGYNRQEQTGGYNRQEQFSGEAHYQRPVETDYRRTDNSDHDYDYYNYDRSSYSHYNTDEQTRRNRPRRRRRKHKNRRNEKLRGSEFPVLDFAEALMNRFGRSVLCSGPPAAGPVRDCPEALHRPARAINWTIWSDYLDPSGGAVQLGPNRQGPLADRPEYQPAWTGRPSQLYGQSDPASGHLHGQSDLTRTSGHLHGQSDLTRTSGHLHGQSDLPHTSGHLHGQSDLTRTSGYLQGQSDLTRTSGHLHGQSDPAHTSGHLQGQSDPAHTSGHQQDYLPPHLRDDFPFDIQVLGAGVVGPAPLDVNGQPMRPGPQVGYRKGPAGQWVPDRASQLTSEPGGGWESRIWTGAGDVATLLGFLAIGVVLAVLVAAATTSDGGWTALLARSSSGWTPREANEEALELLVALDNILRHGQYDCLRARLCHLGREVTWPPAKSALSVGLALASSEEGPVQRAEVQQLKTLLDPDQPAQCDKVYPRCRRKHNHAAQPDPAGH